MKDILGKEIVEGAEVKILKAQDGSIRAYDGKVVGFTPQKVKVMNLESWRKGHVTNKNPEYLIVKY